MSIYYDTSIFANNLKRFLDEKNMNGADLAKLIPCTKSIVSDWLKGKKLPRTDKIDRMCIIFNCKRSDLVGQLKEDSEIIQLSDTLSVTGKIAIYGVIAAGQPIFADQYIIDYVLTAEKHPENFFGLKVKGDSMINAGIQNGAYVIFEKQNTAENGDIVACRLNGDEATLKRFRQHEKTVILSPENPSYEPIILSTDDFENGYAEILGIAKQIVTKL